MGQGSAVEVLADAAMQPWWSAGSTDTRDRVRCSLRDWLAVAVAGATETDVVRIASLVPSVPTGDRVATVLGREGSASVAEAALLNGMAGHVLDYDDTTLGPLDGHPSGAVLPALLALAECSDSPLGAVLEAYVCGVQVADLLGSWVSPEHYAAGWHATATVGSIGAAAAAARMMELSTEEVEAAISLAVTQAAGVRASFGTMAKSWQVGRGASSAVYSALLASAGVRGPLDVLSEHPGLVVAQDSMGRPRSAAAVSPDRSAEPAVAQTLIKWHASCHITHALIEAVATLGVVLDDVERLEVGIRPELLGVCGIEEPATPLELKFSTRGVVAMALAGLDTAEPASYASSTLTSERWNLAMRKVVVRPVDLESPWQATATLTDVQGRTTNVTADLRRWLPVEEIEQRVARKFDRLVGPVLGASATDRLWALLDEPDTQSVAEVMAAAAGGLT